MNIFIVKSGSEEFGLLTKQIGNLAQIKLFEDESSLFLNIQDCDAILLDLDTNTKKTEKTIKSLKKSEETKPIIVLCNSLEDAKLQKHQNSRSAADIYLTYPMDDEILALMIEEAMNSATPDDTKTFQLDLSGEDNFEIAGSDAQEIPESEAVEEGFDLSLGGDVQEIDLSLTATEIEEEEISDNDEIDFGVDEGSISITEFEQDGQSDNADFDLSLSDEEIQQTSASKKISFDEDPISLDDDITMGGIDLSDLGEKTTLMSLSHADPEKIEEPEEGIANDELSFGEGDGGLDLGLDEEPVVEDESDDLAGIEFSLGDENDVPEEVEEEEEEEDDFQTKLREIDEMLKEDTSVALVEEDEYLEQSLVGTPLPESVDHEEDGTHDDPLSESYEFSGSLSKEHKEYVHNHSGELVRLGETIKSLRLDREQLMEKVHILERKESSYNDDLLTMRAQLDEKKIENSILKKRHSQRIEDLNLQLELLADKRMVLEEKNKHYEGEFLKLRKDKMLDVNKVRSRERELEGKLELLRKDAEVQVRNRDLKILELKRRIDTLEFDVESSTMKEKQSLTDQSVLETKMNKVITTLRSAIGQLEDESAIDERRKKMKKNLDV